MDQLIAEVNIAAREVAATLGAGFQKEVYAKALSHEMGLHGTSVKMQVFHSLMYKGASVKDYSADLVVAGRLVVGLNCEEQFSRRNESDVVSFLKASGLYFGLLIAFHSGGVYTKRVANPDLESAAA